MLPSLFRRPLDLIVSKKQQQTSSSGVQLDHRWEALGPFPIGTRELPIYPDPIPLLQFGSHEALPFNTSTYASALADGGRITWSTFEANTQNGGVEVSYPNIRWEYARGCGGWASLQHITYLRTHLRINADRDGPVPMALSFNLVGGYEFAILPSVAPGLLQWFQGDSYSYASSYPAQQCQSIKGTHPFAHHVTLPTTPNGEYTVIVKCVYDIRTMGDPKSNNLSDPRCTFNLQVKRLVPKPPDVYATSAAVPDVIYSSNSQGDPTDHQFSSVFIGFVLRNWNSAQACTLLEARGKWLGMEGDSVSIEIIDAPVVVAPTQLSSVGIRLPFSLDAKHAREVNLEVEFVLSGLDSVKVEIPFRVKHKHQAFSYTFLDADHSVDYAICLPPLVRAGKFSPPPASKETPAAGSSSLGPLLVALHGAGVEADTDFWTTSIPQRTAEWIVFPTGRTPWGWDWHGPSLRNIEHAIGQLSAVSRTWNKLLNEPADNFNMPDTESLIVLGHSNGGQGAWYLSSRYPDRVRAVLPAAAYIKIEDYVPGIYSQSKHQLDPFLTSILAIPQSIYGNDFHISNLFDKPMLIKHGEIDDNVPADQSKILFGLVQAWGGECSQASFEGVPNRKHWFEDVFKSSTSQEFINKHAAKDYSHPDVSSATRRISGQRCSFTLTTSNPSESGSLKGFRIILLTHVWQLGRIQVRIECNTSCDEIYFQITTTNVKIFGLPAIALPHHMLKLEVDGQPLNLAIYGVSPAAPFTLVRTTDKCGWKPISAVELARVQRRQPFTQILVSEGPINIVYGTRCDTNQSHLFSIATRLSHALFIYFRLRIRILSDVEATDLRISIGNIVIIGNSLDNHLFHQQDLAGPVSWSRDLKSHPCFTIGAKQYDDPDQGIIYQTVPPNIKGKLGGGPMTVVISGNSGIGIESALRLFPIRSGLNLPDWTVIQGGQSNQVVVGAGFWTNQWGNGLGFL